VGDGRAAEMFFAFARLGFFRNAKGNYLAVVLIGFVFKQVSKSGIQSVGIEKTLDRNIYYYTGSLKLFHPQPHSIGICVALC